MDIVTIDFETYYDNDFSLSKMTTEQYVRDPRFEIIGLGIKVNDWPTDWYSGDNPGKFLKGLDYSHRAILCHNTAFDGAILSWHFGIRPKLWLDTLSMARPLHHVTVGGSLDKLTAHYELGKKGTEVVSAKGKRRADFTPEELEQYGKYCINDVNLTKKLFDNLKKRIPPTELMVIDQTLRMYTEPVIELDVPLLQQHMDEVRQRKAELLASLGKNAQEIIMSNDKFAAYLRDLGVEPPTKTSNATGKTTWAFAKTDKGLTDLLEHPDVRVQTAVSVRLGAKSTIEETRTESLLGVAQRGRLPIMLNYYGAHTGRFSGGDKLNLQNLPSRGNTTIRRALKAPPGQMLISCDSSQIEARTVAWLAGQDDLVQAFRDKRDVYSEFATKVYGRTITKADKVERFVGKTCILGLGYGMGAAKLQRTLEIGQGGINVVVDLPEAERIVRLYRQENFKIVQLWQTCGNTLKNMLYGTSGEIHPQVRYSDKGIRLPNGLWIQYHGLRATPSGFEYINDARQYRKLGTNEDVAYTRIYGGKVTENVVQALAALVIREQMVKAGQHFKLAFQVHDEIIICVPEDNSLGDQATLEAIMSTPPKWAPDLPVACESGVAANYGDT